MTAINMEFNRRIEELHNINAIIKEFGIGLGRELNRKTGDAIRSREEAKRLFNEIAHLQQTRDKLKRKIFNNFDRDTRCRKRSQERERIIDGRRNGNQAQATDSEVQRRCKRKRKKSKERTIHT